MRNLVVLLLSIFLSSQAVAANLKKAGPELAKHGVTAFQLENVARGLAKLGLYEKDSRVADVTVRTTSDVDHVVTFVPVAGETIVVESMLSQRRVTFRSGDESVTNSFDGKKWNRSGSESLFLRAKKTASIVAALIGELSEAGLLPPSRTEPSADDPNSDSANSPGMASAACSGGARLFGPQTGRGVVADSRFYLDTGSGSTGTQACTGPRQTCVAAGSLASRACNDAKSKCNTQCWNQYCIGCCKFDDCNKICLMGDYYCDAQIDGYACAYKDVNP